MRGHLEHHGGDLEGGSLHSFVPAGTKQLKVIKALFDNDRLCTSGSATYLHRSAVLIRSSVSGQVDHSSANIDKEIRLVLTAQGIHYQSHDYILESQMYRRAKNLFYDLSFAKALIRESLLQAGRTKMIRCQLVHQYITNGCNVAQLLPVNARDWLVLLEDVMCSPFVKKHLAALLEECIEHKEFHVCSLDATIKCARQLKGQGDYRMAKALRNSACVKDGEAMRRVLTVRGRTGAVLCMVPIQSEARHHLAEALQRHAPKEALEQIHFLGMDRPLAETYQSLRVVCPNLKALYLDPVHLVITMNQSQWRQPSNGQTLLRTIQAKFNKVDYTTECSYWGSFVHR